MTVIVNDTIVYITTKNTYGSLLLVILIRIYNHFRYSKIVTLYL